MIERLNRIAAAVRANKAALQTAQEDNASFVQLIRDTRDGLTPVPVSGEAWDATHRYITGDTVAYDGVNYTALRYSRNRQPDQSTEYWEQTAAPTYRDWTEIVDGTVIYVDDIVTYGGSTWICSDQHIKSTVYKPKAGSSKWILYGG